MENQATAKGKDLWVPKLEAAAMVGLSVRSLERLAARGHFTVQTVPRREGRRRGSMAVYSRADLEAYIAGSPNQYAVAVPESEQAAVPAALVPQALHSDLTRASPARVDNLRSVEGYLARLLGAGIAVAQQIPAAPNPGGAQQASPAAEKPWMTLEEAVEFSGLPASFLRKAARSGVDWAVDVGWKSKQPGGHWRFNRAALSKPLSLASHNSSR